MENILIIDDNKYVRYILTMLFEDSGFIVEAASDKPGAIEKIHDFNPGVIILDKKLQDCDGLELLGEIKKINKDLPVIILTAYSEDDNSELAMKAGAYAFLTKPFDNAEIISTVKKALSYNEQ